jgi:NAD(P)H dehydrogenase (quinone)
MANVVIVYHSARGHTARQAEAVREGAAGVAGVEVILLPVSDVAQHWATLAAADAVIFGCPTHMGSASAAFKGFMDESVQAWRNGAWRDKLAAGFTSSANASGDKLATLMQLAVFAGQHGMLWIGMDLPGGGGAKPETPPEERLNRLGGWLGALAQAPFGSDPATSLTAGDLATAAHLGRRVAAAALRWRLGGGAADR